MGLVLILPILLSALEEYPEWFLYQHKYPEITVGFAYGSAPAVMDAEIRYTTYKDCFASGIIYWYKGFDVKHSDYYYYSDPKVLKKLKGKLQPVDQIMSNAIKKQFIGAFVAQEDVKLPRKFIKAHELSCPKWVASSQFYKEDGYYYGVGMYPLGSNENDAWMTAEERAIFNIMTGVEIQFHVVTIMSKSDEGDDLEKVQAIKFKHHLSNIQVVERFPDTQKNVVYVKVRIPQNNVTPIKTKKNR
jgi:hypothetical protein